MAWKTALGYGQDRRDLQDPEVKVTSVSDFSHQQRRAGRQSRELSGTVG